MKKLFLLLIIPFLSFGQNLGFDVVTLDSTFTSTSGCAGTVNITAYQVPDGKVAKVQHSSTDGVLINGIQIGWVSDNPLWLDSGDIIVISGSVWQSSWVCNNDCSCSDNSLQYSYFLSLLEFDK